MRRLRVRLLAASFLLSPLPLLGQTEVEELRAQLAALKEQQAALLAQDDALMEKVDRLMNAVGASIHGDFSLESVARLSLPTHSPLFREWPTVGYADVVLRAQPNARSSGEAVLGMQHIFGAGVTSQYGVRWFHMQVQGPLSLELGDIRSRLSPLTLWAVEDPHEFEISALARRRQEGLQRVFLGDERWHLRGARLWGGVDVGSLFALNAEGQAARLAVPQAPYGSVVWPYEQWLFAARSGVRGLSLPVWADLTWLEIMDLADSYQTVSPARPDQARRDSVLSVRAGFSVAGRVSVSAEAAFSNSSDDLRVAEWRRGQALLISLTASLGPADLSAWGISNDEDFRAPAAQTRVHDLTGDSPLVLANNAYNPATEGYGVGALMPAGPNNYNAHVLDNGTRQQHDLWRYNSLPQGKATPNRAGFGADGRLSLFGGVLGLEALGSLLQEQVKPAYERLAVPEIPGGPRRFARAGAGLRLARPGGWPLSVAAGMVVEDSRGDSPIALSSSRLDGELSWHMTPRLDLVLGLEHLDVNGRDLGSFSGGLPVYPWLDFVADSWSVEWRWRPSPQALGVLSWVYHDLAQGPDAAGSLGVDDMNVQEGCASFRLSF